MANDRQKEMWMMGQALKYMTDNKLVDITPAVEAHILSMFVPNEDVDNALIAKVIKELPERLEPYL